MCVQKGMVSATLWYELVWVLLFGCVKGENVLGEGVTLGKETVVWSQIELHFRIVESVSR